MFKRYAALVALAVMVAVATPVAQKAAAPKTTAPKEQFGFDIGDNYRLVNYTQYVDYLKKLDAQSERMMVVDIGNADVLADIGQSAGIEPVRMRQALADARYLPRLLEQEQLAHRLGVNGVPAIFVGDDLDTAEPVIGAVPYDWLQAAVDRALSGDSVEWRRRALRSAIPLKESD